VGDDLVKAFGLPAAMLGTLVKPGTELARGASVAAETGLRPIPVIAWRRTTRPRGAAVPAVIAETQVKVGPTSARAPGR